MSAKSVKILEARSRERCAGCILAYDIPVVERRAQRLTLEKSSISGRYGFKKLSSGSDANSGINFEMLT
jgi:hypothetical protein